MKMLKPPVLILIFLVSWINVFAQKCLVDSLVSASAFNNVARYYQTAVKQPVLNNGTEFISYDPEIKGHAYFQSDQLKAGSIIYDGVRFQNINLMYDLLADQVITEHFSKNFYITLIPELVGEFTIQDNYFRRIRPDSTIRSAIPEGFYQILYDKKVCLLVKRIKVINEYAPTSKVEKAFVAHNAYFISIKNQYFPIFKQQTVLTLFRDKSKEIKHFIKEQRIKYRKDPENALLRIVRYYDEISNRHEPL